MTEFWIWFWGLLLLVTLILYAGLAVVVSVGGFRDVRAMFRDLDRQHGKRSGEDSEEDS